MKLSTMYDVVLAGVGYGVSMFGAGFVLGTIRVLLLEPSIGELAAVLVELPLMTPICWQLSGLFAKKLDKVRTSGLVVGPVALSTLLLLEVALALLFGKTLQEVLQDHDSTKGRIGLVGQVVASFFPVWRLRRKQKVRNE